MTRGRLPLAKTITPEVLLGIADGESRVARTALEEGSAGVVHAAELASTRAHALREAAIERAKPAIACKEGCSFCCHAKVLALAPEVLRIADHLRSTLDAEAFAKVLERVRGVDAVTRGLSRVERAAERIACPLLENDRCSVYEVRPIVCGGWCSLDVDACEASFEDPAAKSAPVFAEGYELANAVLAGLGKACFEAGLDGTPLELIAALRIALERPNAHERYVAKRPIFQAAHDAEWLRANTRSKS